MAKRKGRNQGVVVGKPGASGAGTAAASQEPAPAVSAEDKGSAQQRKKKKQRRSGEDSAPAASARRNKEELEESEDEGEGEEETEAPQPPPALQRQVSNLVVSGPDAEASAAAPRSPWTALSGTRADAEAALAWLVWPLTPAIFLSEYWEKKPLHLKRNRPDYYEGLFSKAELDKHLRDTSEAKYGERINLARFDDKTGKKVDLNRGPRGTPVKPQQVNDAWASGATLQVMHPQQFQEQVFVVLAALERSFGALFGANSYITPGRNQGLAPHFDDVEVFMLQLEGSKRWRLHEPPAGQEYPLPRDYSPDFLPDKLGPQLLDCSLGQGDLLYFPRGTVHQGVAEDSGSGFSHHLTVSTYQRTAWCNVIEKALAGALDRASSESSEFREGLPPNFLSFMGSWHDLGSSDVDTGTGGGSSRAAFRRHFRGLISRLQEFVDLDEVCDELGVDFMAQRLPPIAPTSGGNASQAPTTAAAAVAGTDSGGVTLSTVVRWVDPSAVRPIISMDPETSEATVVVFHSCSNQSEKHMMGQRDVEAEEDVGCLRYEADTFLPALRALTGLGNASIRCGDLPLPEESDRVAICENLLESGVLELVRSA